MCACVWWWDTDPFTYPSTDYETIIDSDSPSPTGWPTTSASQMKKKKKDIDVHKRNNELLRNYFFKQARDMIFMK